MTKRNINILLKVAQWIVSLLLLSYLIVPVYQDETNTFQGDEYFSPYENWKQYPLTLLRLKDNVFEGSQPDSLLQIQPFLNEDEILILDSTSSNFSSPFAFYHSNNDLQYLIKKEDHQGQLLYNSNLNPEDYQSPLSGIHLQLIRKKEDLDVLDEFLNKGIPLALIAGDNDSTFSYNLLQSEKGDASSCLTSIKEGRNLLAFSKHETLDRNEIPVLRKIEWKNNVLKLDLSQKGEISIISSNFQLDTLANNLKLKIDNVSWFRFEVSFDEDEIYYVSNPYFKFQKEPFLTTYPKANNQLTIFINLSWLLGIILLNLFTSKLRIKYLK